MEEIKHKELIYERMARVLKDLEPIAKEQKNEKQGWSFRGVDDAYNALNPLLGKHEVISTPEKIEILWREKIQSKSGGVGWHFGAKYIWKFSTVDGSFILAESIGVSIDYGDKYANKAASIAHKYALIEAFCIATAEKHDPDNQAHDDILPQDENPAPPGQALKYDFMDNQAPPKTNPRKWRMIQDDLNPILTAAKNQGWTKEQLNTFSNKFCKKDINLVDDKRDYDVIYAEIVKFGKSYEECMDDLFRDMGIS